jgi:MarR family transcriptional regulator, organic hydroperoxide resistance regulator
VVPSRRADRAAPPSAVLALQRATHRTLALLAKTVAEAGLELTASEMNVLANLAERGDLTISELGSAAGSRPTTLTGVLDRLERRGDIIRAPHATDRRAVVIRLTPAGRATATSIRTAIAELESRALEGVASEQLAGFHAVVGRLAEEPG